MSWVGGVAFELMTFLKIFSIYLFILVGSTLGLLATSAVFYRILHFRGTPLGHVLFCPALQMILKTTPERQDMTTITIGRATCTATRCGR